MELRHFTYFKAVAEELNLRKVADHLFISQPGLSRQIKQLEEELQAPLFEQDKKQVKEITEGREGELRIGFLGSAANLVLPNLLTRINLEQPLITTILE